MSARTATLILGRDCGDALADEADFLAWVSYVSARIDDATGLDVAVDIRGARDIQTDAVSPRGGAEEEAITSAIEDLWESFCADTSAWPVREAAITNEQIESLRTSAGSAGDRVQVAVCDLALGNEVSIELDEHEAHLLERLDCDTQDKAVAECTRVIRDAEAQP